MSPRAKEALTGVKPFSERVIMATFQSNPATTIISAYSPTSKATDEATSTFYETLRDAIQSVPKHNFLAVLGDFNGRLGADNVPHSFHQEANANGDLMEEHALVAANTRFRKPKKKLWTRLSPPDNNQEKYKQQINFILVRKKWRKSIRDAQAFNSFASVGSDHRVVSAKVRLSLQVPKKQARRKVKYVWGALECDQVLQEKYAVEVRNRFKSLEADEDATDRYERFIKAHEGAAQAALTPISKRKKVKFYSNDPRVLQVRQEMEAAYVNLVAEGKQEEGGYIGKKEQLNKVYDKVMAEDLAKKIKNTRDSLFNNQSSKGWALVKEVTGKGSSFQPKSTCGTVTSKNLGSSPVVEKEDEETQPVFWDLLINDGPFTIREYQSAKSSFKPGKGCGEDRIVPEVLKWVPIDDLVLNISNKAFVDRELPKHWTVLNIIPIPKTGDPTKADNYRGISLSSVVAKVYSRMILNRIRPVLDPLLRKNQNGFREKRSTVSKILALRRIIEGVNRKHLPAVMAFIDFKKAFDSVHRRKLMEILQAYGIHARIVQAISDVYANTSAGC